MIVWKKGWIQGETSRLPPSCLENFFKCRKTIIIHEEKYLEQKDNSGLLWEVVGFLGGGSGKESTCNTETQETWA